MTEDTLAQVQAIAEARHESLLWAPVRREENRERARRDHEEDERDALRAARANDTEAVRLADWAR